MESSDVIDALKLNFPWISLEVKPSIPFSSKKPLIIPSSSLAHTTETSAREPLVIHILLPFKIQSSPSLLQRVAMPPGLEPKLGSVSPKHPILVPAPSPGSHLDFCSSDPKACIGYITRAPCTLANDLRPESPLSSS